MGLPSEDLTQKADPDKPKTEGEKGESDGKKAGAIVAVFTLIEVFSVVLWQMADHFDGRVSNWIHLVSECGFLAGGAYLAHEFVRGAKWICVVWFAWLTMSLFLYKVQFKEVNQSTGDTFSFIARDYVEDETNAPLMLTWNGINDANGADMFTVGRMMSPIKLEIIAQLTNLKDANISVNSYYFEGQLTNGSWQRMTVMDHAMGHVILNKHLEWPLEYHCSKFFDVSMSRNQPMKKGDVIEGEIFLEPPNGFAGEIRIRVKDSSDSEYVQRLDKSAATNYSDDGEIVRRFENVITPLGTNVSHLPVKSYSEEMGIRH